MVNEEKKWYLGIDIGGTSAKYALVSAQGEVRDRGAFPTGKENGKAAFLRHLLALVDDAARWGARGIGISCLGLVDPCSGEVKGGAGNLPFLTEVNILELLRERHPNLPVAMCNDVKAAARGEMWIGAGKGCRSFFCVTFGTGLGGCAVLDGRVLEGAYLRAGEIAYWDYQDEETYCERRLSTGFVMKDAARRLGVEALDGVAFFARVRRGDASCLAILEEWTTGIARLIAHVLLILDPEKIILGGGIAPQSDLLLPCVHAQLRGMLPPDFQPYCPIVPALCGNDAGLLGAVALLLSKTDEARKGGKSHV